MSRKQGPRTAGMRPSAIAVGRRYDTLGNFTAIMRGDGMSRKQGPRTAGMRPSAIAVGRRYDTLGNFTAIMRGDGMNRKQGPRTAGMRPSVHVVRVQLLPSDKRSPNQGLQEVHHGH